MPREPAHCPCCQMTQEPPLLQTCPHQAPSAAAFLFFFRGSASSSEVELVSPPHEPFWTVKDTGRGVLTCLLLRGSHPYECGRWPMLRGTIVLPYVLQGGGGRGVKGPQASPQGQQPCLRVRHGLREVRQHGKGWEVSRQRQDPTERR